MRAAGPTAPLVGAGAEAQGACELVDDIGVSKSRGTGTRDDQNVERWLELGAMAPKELPNEPADAVTLRGTADLAAGGDAEARFRLLFLPGDHDEVRNGLAPPLALQRQELVSLAQANPRREALRSVRARRAQFGCLAGTETVNRLRPLARRRLRTSRPPGVLIRSRNP